jgi:hypothetical protein
VKNTGLGQIGDPAMSCTAGGSTLATTVHGSATSSSSTVRGEFAYWDHAYKNYMDRKIIP